MRFVGESESGRSWLDLLFGDVHFFSHRPRALEVDTPIANAFTEGTEFLVRARPERTEVILLEGRVRLASAGGRGAAGERRCRRGGRGRGAAARDRRPAARCGRLGALLPADPGAAGRAARQRRRCRAGLQRAVERVAANDYAGALAALDAVPDGGARRPLPHLPRGRAAERRPGRRGRGRARAGAGARARRPPRRSPSGR